MNQKLVVLRQLLVSYFEVALAYRFDFLQSIVSSLLWSGFSFVSAILVTSQTPGVFGLGRSDLLLLTSSYGIIVGIHHWLCTRGFAGFWQVIHRGELDGYLLKPFDTVTLLSLRNISWGSSLRVLASVFTTIWIIRHYDLPIGLLQVLGYLLLSIPAFFVIYSIYTLAVTILIWHPYLSNILDLVGNSVGTSRYPLDVTRYTPRFIHVWFIPFLVIVNIPTRALIGRLSWWAGSGFLLFAIGIWLFSRWFWRYALRFYTSASG